MTVLNKLAYFQNIRNDVPNQELARELAEEKNKAGIEEIVENLENKEKKIRSNCIKVLYEIGYISPELIADYVFSFLKLLRSRDNRMVWSGMFALSTIAELKATEIFDNLDEILEAIAKGSVITIDGGIKTLSLVASTKKEYQHKIFPYLLNHLKNCRPKEIAMHAEFIMKAVDSNNKTEFIEVLNKRSDILKPTQLKRIQKIFKQLDDC